MHEKYEVIELSEYVVGFYGKELRQVEEDAKSGFYKEPLKPIESENKTKTNASGTKKLQKYDFLWKKWY